MTIFSCRNIVTAIAATMAASLFGQAASAITLKEAKAQGYVRVAIHNEPPYAYMDAEGKAVGIGPETVSAVLKRMGIPDVVWVVTPFSTLIPGMLAGRWDMVGAQQTIFPARCQQVAFAEPTNAALEALLVKKGNPKNIHGYDDIASNNDVKVATVSGTTELNYLHAYKVPDDRITIIANHADGAELVMSGRADAYTMEEPSAALLLSSGNVHDLEIAKPFKLPVIDGKEVVSFGATTFRKEDKEFLAAYDKELKAFTATPEFMAIQTGHGFSEESVKKALATTAEARCNVK
jgi:polar amino acid transport system substrate-binding protein